MSEVVGKRFRGWPGLVYVVTRWERRAGYWVTVVSGSDPLGARKVGDVACISERAIGRTYHEIHPWQPDYAAPLAEHEQPCDCRICEETRR